MERCSIHPFSMFFQGCIELSRIDKRQVLTKENLDLLWMKPTLHEQDLKTCLIHCTKQGIIDNGKMSLTQIIAVITLPKCYWRSDEQFHRVFQSHKRIQGLVLTLDEINNVEFIINILAFTMETMQRIDAVSKEWI